MSGTELPPPYYALSANDNAQKEDETKEQNTTEVHIPDSEPHDIPENYGPLFENKDTRIAFIQKVLTIKLLQAVATTIIMLVFVACPYSIYHAMMHEEFTRINLIVVSTLILLATLGLLHYCNKARFIMPYNYLFLAVYPLSVGFFISVVTFNWGLDVVFISWVHFNFVLFALMMFSIFALQTSLEFKTNICLIMAGVIFIVAYVLTVPFLYGVSAFGILYCSLMMFALTAYVVNDLQAMMSKTYRIHLTPSEYVKAALILHIDYRYQILKFYKMHCPAMRPLINDNAA